MWRGGLRRVARALEEDLAEAEVEELGAAVGREHDVRRRDVPVEDPVLVRDLEALEDLDRDVDALVDGEAGARP